jgi:heat shock protein beta
MRLYVNRVFINDKFEDLLPRWLIFVRGVVDSDDLPLNVGREILQNSRSLRLVKHRLTKKSIDMMSDVLAQNRSAYLDFWRKFGKYIKVGTIEEEQFRSNLVPLCLFYSSNRNSTSSGMSLLSLPEYVSRMPEDQRAIYYVTGDTIAQAAASPLLERLRRKNFEVIYVAEPVDEMTLQSIEKYGDYPIIDVGKESTGDLTEAERREKQLSNDNLQPFRDWMCNILGGRVSKVEVSSHLVDSPAVVVQSEHGLSPSMQKYIRQQSVASMEAAGDAGDLNAGANFPDIFNQAILEINPSHPIITSLQDLFAKDPSSDKAKEIVELTFETAKLSAGYSLGNAAAYAKLVTNVMTEIAVANSAK